MTARRRARDEEFIDFASATQQALYHQAVLLTGNPATAQDLVQETLLKVYRAWHRESIIEHPRAYSRMVLTNEFLMARRRDHFAVARDADPPEAMSPREGAGVDERLTIMRALSQLPPRMRAVIVLRYWEDLSVEQTAQVLNCSTGTVKSTANRGLARMRGLLGDTFTMTGVQHD